MQLVFVSNLLIVHRNETYNTDSKFENADQKANDSIPPDLDSQVVVVFGHFQSFSRLFVNSQRLAFGFVRCDKLITWQKHAIDQRGSFRMFRYFINLNIFFFVFINRDRFFFFLRKKKAINRLDTSLWQLKGNVFLQEIFSTQFPFWAICFLSCIDFFSDLHAILHEFRSFAFAHKLWHFYQMNQIYECAEEVKEENK